VNQLTWGKERAISRLHKQEGLFYGVKRMKQQWCLVLALVVLIGSGTVSAVNTTQTTVITELFYDTYLKGDTDGEFIRLHNPTETTICLGGWQITDCEGVITFPAQMNLSAGESIYLAYNATAFCEEMRRQADFEYGVDSSEPTRIMAKSGKLAFSNKGDEVILKDNKGEVIDAVIYGNSRYAGVGWTAPSIESVNAGVILERDRNETTGQYEDTNTSSDWDDYRLYVIGQSHFPYATFSFNGTVTAFTSPDSSFNEIVNAIDSAKESLSLTVYQFHNLYLMDHIIDAIARGVKVRILLEGGPVMGIADAERYIANQIVTTGGEVRFMINENAQGIYDRYTFNHAKYALIDNETTIVTSENWKNTGVPINNTFGNRGWGVLVNNPDVTNYFCEVFFDDWNSARTDSFAFRANDTIYGNKYGSPPQEFVPNRIIPTGKYLHPFDSASFSGMFIITPVLAPDTALLQTNSIIGMINAADSSVYVEQLYIYKDWNSKPNPYLEAVINASRRGCEVKILLESKYGKEHNEATLKYVSDIATSERLELEAKLVDNEAIGLNKTHNKGVIVDRRAVLISSINWNEHSPRNNREVGLIIQNEAVAKYYTDVFLYDWYSGSLPLVAGFTSSATQPVVNQIVLFDASSSSCVPERDITKYQWDFGDEKQDESGWNRVNSWLYQLQNSDLDVIANTSFDLVVIDYCRNQTEVADFYANAFRRGYVPYSTVRDLDDLIINPGYEPGKMVSHTYSCAGNYVVNLTVTDNHGATDTVFKNLNVSSVSAVFDTGAGTYPSIFGTHNGTIKPNRTIEVQTLYTYPCEGTGGHTDYARIWNETLDVTANWTGYSGDWHNVSFDGSFALVKNETYNYTIRTGSYPQIHHSANLSTHAGFITCSEFMDANGKRYSNWVPAMRLV